MKQSIMCGLISGALAISGCAQGGDASGASSAPSIQAAPEDVSEKDDSMTGLKPPSPDSVLYFVYQRDGDGAHSFQVEGGATVGYWYGYAFDLEGEHYFTGFTSRSAGTEGAEADSTTMEEGRVAIGQVTLVQKVESGQAGWSQIATDGFVGEFGRLDQPEMVDESRRAVSHELVGGRLILGVPTRLFEDGVAMSNYALFLFNKNGLPQTPFRVWTYVGTVQAGSDNAEACEGGVMTCAASTGELQFEPSAGESLPRIHIVQSGETIAGPGRSRPLGPEDALVFEFDANTGRYQAR